jgi:hypothetical protein
LFKALQNCREEDYILYYNGLYQNEIGYILDAIIYTASQGHKVKTINPQVTENIREERQRCYEQNKKTETKKNL